MSLYKGFIFLYEILSKILIIVEHNVCYLMSNNFKSLEELGFHLRAVIYLFICIFFLFLINKWHISVFLKNEIGELISNSSSIH